MKKRLIALAVTLLAVVPAFAGKGTSPAASSTVTTVVNDWDLFYQAPYRIRSDFGLRGTDTYYHGVDGVLSHFQSSGAYELDAQSSTVRRMFIDFSDSAGGSLPPTMFAGGGSSGYVAGRFVSKFGGINAMKGVGSTLTGGIPFVFYGADGKHYQVRINSANEPGTSDVTVTCTHVQGSDQMNPTALCNGWRLEPAGTVGTKAIGRLVKNETVRGKTVLTYYGDFYFTLSVQFTQP